MPSPFPGMDPYIEESGRWGDFHLNMLSAMRGHLNARMPRRYRAEIQQYVWIQAPADGETHGLRIPDLFVAVADPATLVLPASEVRKHRYLAVVDQSSDRVVTAVELLSPWNKAGAEARETYLTKRREYLGDGVNLVEIDLLRGGPRLPLGRKTPRIADFYVAIFRSWQLPRFGFWTFGLRDVFPEIPVPLDRETPPTLLAMRPCLDRVYEEGRYGEVMPYDRPLTTPPRRGDAAWVRKVVAGSANGSR